MLVLSSPCSSRPGARCGQLTPYLSCQRCQVQGVDPASVSVDLCSQDARRCLVQPNLPVAVASSNDPVPELHGGAGAAGHRGTRHLLPSRLHTRTPGPGVPSCPGPAPSQSHASAWKGPAGDVRHRLAVGTLPRRSGLPQGWDLVEQGELLSRAPDAQGPRVVGSHQVPSPLLQEGRGVSSAPGAAPGTELLRTRAGACSRTGLKLNCPQKLLTFCERGRLGCDPTRAFQFKHVGVWQC